MMALLMLVDTEKQEINSAGLVGHLFPVSVYLTATTTPFVSIPPPSLRPSIICQTILHVRGRGEGFPGRLRTHRRNRPVIPVSEPIPDGQYQYLS